jgi:hypothetical protein
MKQIALFKLALALPLVCLLPLSIAAQSGGTFEITQSVIANGGGKSADATYAVEGTIAQHAAGSISSSGPYGFRAGFWQSFFAPTAAGVSISGRVFTADGHPISRSRVLLTSSGGVTRTAQTTTFGHYRFDDVEVGHTYLLDVRIKGLQFTPRVVTVLDEITSLDLIALP